MARIRRKKNVNVIRVGVKIIATVIGLYASGIMLTTMGDIMNGTCSPFYTGLKLIGWTVESAYCTDTTATTANTITATSGTGILAVIGLLAVVWVIFEFVDISM